MKRLAPGETNTWFVEIFGTEGGVKFSTRQPKTLWTFQRGKEQIWQRTDLGFRGAFPTVTGGIFEPGFPVLLPANVGGISGRTRWKTRRKIRLCHTGWRPCSVTSFSRPPFSLMRKNVRLI